LLQLKTAALAVFLFAMRMVRLGRSCNHFPGIDRKRDPPSVQKSEPRKTPAGDYFAAMAALI
jgi:hypothetical protein